jgi:hypothetical protein
LNSIEKVEGSYSVELDSGGETNILCEVYPKGVDLANTLRVTLDGTLKDIEAAQGKVEIRVLEAMDTGAHGAVPYLAPTWLYRVATKDGARVGGIKQFIMEKAAIAVYCAHVELGFTRTFAAVAKAFADSLEVQDPAVPPYYVEISTASIGDMEIGVTIATLERDADGDTKAQQMTAFLLSSGEDSIQSQDSTHVQWLRPDATLINASHIEVSNGEIDNDLALRNNDADEWVVEGEVQGKAVKVTLPKGAEPGSWVTQANELRALLAEENPVGREHTISVWLDDNPGVLTPAKTKILAKQDGKSFKAIGEIGTISANLVIEKASGMASGADLKIGPLSMKLERVYVNGKL